MLLRRRRSHLVAGPARRSVGKGWMSVGKPGTTRPQASCPRLVHTVACDIHALSTRSPPAPEHRAAKQQPAGRDSPSALKGQAGPVSGQNVRSANAATLRRMRNSFSTSRQSVRNKPFRSRGWRAPTVSRPSNLMTEIFRISGVSCQLGPFSRARQPVGQFL